MDNNASRLIDNLHHSVFDYISLAQSPAEADMLRFLSYYSLWLDRDELALIPRLKNHTPWDFYTAIHQSDYQQSQEIIFKIAQKFTALKFENELSLNQSEKNLCPYHPLLNRLSPLIVHNKQLVLQELKCFKITQAQPYLDLNYRYFTSDNHLKNQIHELNKLQNRDERLHKMVYAKRIGTHIYFEGLNGQRGVFAKTSIPAGTIIDYYSGEYQTYPDLMPPILCTWRVHKTQSWFNYYWNYRKIKRFNGWTDAFVLGNMMKLVNSCYSDSIFLPDIGNIACYFFHFTSKNYYVSLPVYVAIKDIPKDTELLAFYSVHRYKNNRVYGIIDAI